VRAERYSFDENQLKPYFEMHSVLTKGVFFAAGKLYGLTFKQRTDLPVYNPDMLVYDVFNEDGTQLAILHRTLTRAATSAAAPGRMPTWPVGLAEPQARSSRIT
jgi:Zn-dependent oligopeptidase